MLNLYRLSTSSASGSRSCRLHPQDEDGQSQPLWFNSVNTHRLRANLCVTVWILTTGLYIYIIYKHINKYIYINKKYAYIIYMYIFVIINYSTPLTKSLAVNVKKFWFRKSKMLQVCSLYFQLHFYVIICIYLHCENNILLGSGYLIYLFTPFFGGGRHDFQIKPLRGALLLK